MRRGITVSCAPRSAADTVRVAVEGATEISDTVTTDVEMAGTARGVTPRTV